MYSLNFPRAVYYYFKRLSTLLEHLREISVATCREGR